MTPNTPFNFKRATLFLLFIITCTLSWAKPARQTVVFDVDLHCRGCVTKIEKNISFEPGVKDLICNLEQKTVTVVFDPAKTSIEKLQQAFAKINKPATLHSPTSPTQNETADR